MKFKKYPRRDPIKNYFPLPNEIYHLGLSAGAIAVYGYLLCIENRETYQAQAGYKTIGRAVKMSANTVAKYVRELEDKQLIRTEQTVMRAKDGRPLNGTLRYMIRPIQEAVDCYHARQMQELELSVEQQKMQAKLSQHSEPQEPSCTTPIESEGSSTTQDCEASVEPLSGEGRRTKRKAGESTGAFVAPVRSQPPAVRAVSGCAETIY